MRERNVVPAQVLAEAETADPIQLMRLGVQAARGERYARGLVLLAEAYRIFSQEVEVVSERIKDDSDTLEVGTRRRIPASCLSYYGLCLAHTTPPRTAEGARFCEVAIQLEPHRGEHYLNLARIFQAARVRASMVSALERGLVESPNNVGLLEFQREIGYRAPPPLKFLPRENPLNKGLGMVLRGGRAAGESKPGMRASAGAAERAKVKSKG
jgi:hypothetical protein